MEPHERDFRLRTELGPAVGPGARAALGATAACTALFFLAVGGFAVGEVADWPAALPATALVAAIAASAKRQRRRASSLLLAVSGAALATWLAAVAILL